MKKINTIEDVREALKPLGKVVGLGVTAFPRIEIAHLLHEYEIVCIKESKDLEFIRKDVAVKSVKRDFEGRVEKLNVWSLLKHKGVQRYLGSLGSPFVFVYKSSKNIEDIVDRLGCKLLSTRSEIREVYENKWSFRQEGLRAGFPIVAGEQLLIDELTLERYGNFQKKYGERLVFQITDYGVGGGIGTFFVTSKEVFDEFHAFVGRRRAAGRNLKKVNVTEFIEGESASISTCATRYGVLTSRVQRQITDIREVVGLHNRNGVFCGHDWGERYSNEIDKKAHKIAQKVGEHMYKNGYKGIFGIDVVVNRGNGEVKMVEVNSRYTAAFPVYSMLQRASGEIPMDAWHLLEFSGIEYDMDFQAVQEGLWRVKKGSQLILHNLERAWVAVRGEVKAGVYKFSDKGVEWVREGFAYADLGSDDEFVLTDGVPWRNIRLKPGARIGRIVFKREVLKDDRDELRDDVKRVVMELYGRYKLEKIKKKK